MTPYCIFLMGPTASGKTDLALSLVKHLACDIISVDSAMVYKEMDIGTAKPSKDILAQTPHRLIDIRDPADPYSAAQFCQDALAEIKTIHAAGRIPLLVGGTMLYFHTLQQGISDLPSANSKIRERLNLEAEQIGWKAMHQRLSEIDPISAQRIHFNDPQRIQRALEVYEISGKTMTEWYAQKPAQAWSYPTIKIILSPAERHILHEKIAQRFHMMLSQGFIEEVRALFERGDLSLELPAIRSVGYRQAWHYLMGELTKDELTELAIIATRQLAKRQLTWLRTQTDAIWIDSQEQNITPLVLKYLNKIYTLSRNCNGSHLKR
jgi:tRNA dimethylallyltransferase